MGPRKLSPVFLSVVIVISSAAAEATVSVSGRSSRRKIIFRSKTLNLDKSFSSGEVKSALVVNVKNLYNDNVINIHNVCYLLSTLNIKL